jgi:hypothetical protein
MIWRRVLRAGPLAPILAVPLVLASAVTATAKVVDFQTPSKRIVCAYVTGVGERAFVRCDLRFLNDRAAVLEAGRKARKVKVTDAVGDPRSPVLAYGKSRSFGRFTCTSRTTGLTCRDRRSGHGFEVSRERQRLF